MNEQYPWRFEECENEGPIRDPKGIPWAHAVRGRKPQRPVVLGYGHTPNAADADARTKASQQDAREVLGERGEVVMSTTDNIITMPAYMSETDLAALRKEIREYFSQPHEWKIIV